MNDAANELVQVAGRASVELLERFHAQRVSLAEGVAKLYNKGLLTFDLLLRGLGTATPAAELYIATTRGSDLVDSQALTRPNELLDAAERWAAEALADARALQPDLPPGAATEVAIRAFTSEAPELQLLLPRPDGRAYIASQQLRRRAAPLH